MVNAAFSQVRTLSEVAAMERIFSEQVFGGAAVCSCRILHFRYKPGCTWIVSYAVSLAGAEEERIVYLRACERRGSAARYAKSLALGQDVRWISDLDSVAWIFPSDRKLAGLRALCDDSLLRSEVLPRLVEAAFGPGWIASSFSHEIVHYLPERSCMVRADAQVNSTTDPGRQATATFYGKTYPDEQGAETYRYLSELRQSTPEKSAALGLAKPLLYEPHNRTMWQLSVGGAGLNVRARCELESAAMVLARLHQSAVSALPAYPSAISRLHQAAEVVGAAMPDYADSIDTLVRELHRRSECLAKRRPATLHGDLHLKNFLVLRDHVALIDLDTLAFGDPVEDLASFAAAQYSAGLAEGIPEDESRRSVTAFIKAYEWASGLSIPEFDLNWHIAAALTTERALRAVTRMKSDSPSPDALLDVAWRFARLAQPAAEAIETTP